MKNPKITREIIPIMAALFLAATTFSSRSQVGTECLDTNGVKYLQPPNLSGYDVSDSLGYMLADDFVCTSPGPITGIHIWGSWLYDAPGTITNFWLAIYSNVPAMTVGSTVIPSHPGMLLWSNSFPIGQFVQTELGPSQEQFISPASVNNIGPDTNVWYYCFFPANPFYQTGTPAAPTIYWLAAYAQGIGFGPQYFNAPQYGWKTTPAVQNDVSVFTPWTGALPGTGAPWSENTTPANSPNGAQPLDLAFELTSPTNSTPAPCGDTNTVKVYFPPQVSTQQPPGVNVQDSRDNGIVLADDFPCNTTGPITGIHVWGSWLSDVHGSISNFWIGIYSDVPAVTSPASGQILTNSQPGQLLWFENFAAATGQFTETFYTNAGEYFLNPVNNALGTDTQVYQYCFFPTNPFVQMGTAAFPTNYWLAIRAQLYDTNAVETNSIYGWKSTYVAYGDPAVWGTVVGGIPNGIWQSMTNPTTGTPLNLSMLLTTMTTTNCTPTVRCVGDKTVYCSAGATWGFDPPVVIDPCCSTAPTITTNAVTNSITACSQSYTAYFTVSDCNGIVSTNCSQTVTVLDTNAPIFLNCLASTNVPCGTPWSFSPPAALYVCSQSNVVVGILNSNASVQSPCITTYTVTWSATNQCSGAVAFCQESAVVEDSYPPIINCGTNFTVTWPNSWTFTAPAASYVCSGMPVPVTILSSNVDLTRCGTTNTIVWLAVNQCSQASVTCTQVVAVVCPCQETNGVIKYTQGPNTTTGYDVWNGSSFPPNASDGPWLLADDFVCTNTGYITDIHIWGSWLNDQALPNTITFWVGIFTDGPTNATKTFSSPGNLIWSECFAPGQYSENYVSPSTEYFLDPGTPSILGGDSKVWYYCFYPTNPPIQNGRVSAPKTYWLAVFAQQPAGVPYYFGWKTTTGVQNDISVHGLWTFGACPTALPTNGVAWTPTRDISGNPLDLAFQISTATNCSASFLTIDHVNDVVPPVKVVITWPSGVLQGATNVTGPYFDIPGAVSPYTNFALPFPPTNRFYRVRCD
jgi:hypothetical protein